MDFCAAVLKVRIRLPPAESLSLAAYLHRPPDSLSYGQAFQLRVPRAAEIIKVTWIRLGSVTHSFDQNQRLNTLAFTKGEGEVTATAPANANLCPPAITNVSHLTHLPEPTRYFCGASASCSGALLLGRIACRSRRRSLPL